MDDVSSAKHGEQKATDKSFGVAAPKVVLPKGGGAIRGIGEKFTANPVTGTGNLTVPIATSPGRNGFGPQLSLSYDSGAGNGPFGLGWNLALPAITRRTDKGLPQYRDADESDTFLISGAEDLVPALIHGPNGDWIRDTFQQAGYVVTRYRPRIEGLFARIERWTRAEDGDTYWRTISKDNVTSYYGRTIASRVADPENRAHIFSWLICESNDDRGNSLIYEYLAEDSSSVSLTAVNERNRNSITRSAERYPKRIKYGNVPSRLIEPDVTKLRWLFEVVFDYGEGHYLPQATDAEGREFVAASLTANQQWPVRQDAFSRYRSGFEVRTYRLCRRVLMFHHFAQELGTPDYLVRATEFGYLESPRASFIISVTQSGLVRQSDGRYLKRSLPPVEFEYSKAQVQQRVSEVDPDSLANLPASVDGGDYQWLDLDGEGLQCILAERDGAWYYKRNLSPLTAGFVGNQPTSIALLGPMVEVAKLPGFARAARQLHQFLDLTGDGQLDCVVFDRSQAGFFERTEDEDWDNFESLPSMPNVDWTDPNLRFIDLDGDGHADVLISEDEVFTWYHSLAESGFGAANRVSKARDEEQGPAVVFADGTQSMFLADMCGDDLTDIVRIRNGEVCYWPNLGYGRFGRKVTIDQAPWFESPDLFDARRLRLADIDGTGPIDILYLAADGVRLYFNQSGNSFSAPEVVSLLPQVNDLAAIQTLDILGNGTACLVWTSSEPGSLRRTMRYVDLMGGQKPHLLTRSRNNLGAETRMFYAPSNKFYLSDRRAGRPWATRLPFPVHVVERVETYDWVSRNRFVTRYTYHHGYFDGIEREFRGFGMVEQQDTEELAALNESGVFPNASNIDSASYVPPILTKTWFHTGAYPQGSRISRLFQQEYYRESDASGGVAGLSDAAAEAMQMPDTVLPSDVSGDEIREAIRSLKGALLRQEIYSLDGTDKADRPYSVSEQNYTIKKLQPLGENHHAVFFTHARESIDFHYERMLYDIDARKLADPRVNHSMVLAVDDYGNALQSASIAYSRRHDDPSPLLTAADRSAQKTLHTTYSESAYTNPTLAIDAYRTPLPAETRTYELLKVAPDGNLPDITNLFGFEEMASKLNQASDGQHEVAYEDIDSAGAIDSHPYRRLIEHVRTLYLKDDLTGGLPLGSVESLALPFQSYKLAFTPGLLSVYRRNAQSLLPAPANILRDEGGYVLSEDKKSAGLFPSSDADGLWWVCSEQVFFSPNAADTAAQELALAQAHFFSPRRVRDPFGNSATVLYDTHDLLLLETEDALHNKVTVGERQNDGGITNGNDYRALQPELVTDPNGNRSQVAFDGFGLVVGTAVMGKSTESLGDSLVNFVADLTQAEIDEFFANPKGLIAADLLRGATSRIVYDLTRFSAAPSTPDTPLPTFAATIVRETHVSDLAPDQNATFQVGFSYSDGFGREIQKKVQAEPGPLAPGGETLNPRWVASGWTILNNKGKPVRQYEPFFDDTHDFKFGVTVGVSPILFYDPEGRVVATLHPDHTWQKVQFDPWRTESWDVSDTVLIEDPKTDSDVGSMFARLPDSDYLPGWYGQRQSGGLGPEEQDAARKSALHADTPAIAYADSLGRAFLTVAHNKFKYSNSTPGDPPIEEFHLTRVVVDIEGNQRAVTDAKDRIVMRYDYDMLGTRIHHASMEAGERWMLGDVAGKPIRAWDSRDHTLRSEYDELRRLLRSFVQGVDAQHPATEILVARTEYGEGEANDLQLNLRMKPFRVFDGAGLATSQAYDFKGNLLRASRRLAQDYRTIPNWLANPGLELPTFASSTTYDALNRPKSVTAPDQSVYRPSFNEAGLLEKVDANLRGASAATSFVINIDYDAKGRRVLIEYGNSAKTEYSYDLVTLRLTHLKTTQWADDVRLQDLSYTYDAAGNITQIQDNAQQSIHFNNQLVTASNNYTYDAISRLINAEGREHIGQTSFDFNPPDGNYRDYPFVGHQVHPNDGQAMRRYTEKYEYDPVGNLLQLIHQAMNGNWTRSYVYKEPSLIELGKNGNRLTNTTVGGNNPELYSYDAHGNMIAMPHLTLMQWDLKDQLQATARQVVNSGTPETTYYVYDAGGQRARKVTERQSGTRKNERIYVDGFELYREYDSDGTTVTLERETLHVMDDKHRIALVETKTVDDKSPIPNPQLMFRYQLGNHLGSANLELDEQTSIISYEEYFPYGCTSYQAMRSSAGLSLKRYRYTGMERDEESGLSYHAARYYVPWVQRWLSCDPIGVKDGLNLYRYAFSNPLSRTDPTGTESGPKEEKEKSTMAEITEARDALIGGMELLTKHVEHGVERFGKIADDLAKDARKAQVAYKKALRKQAKPTKAKKTWLSAAESVKAARGEQKVMRNLLKGVEFLHYGLDALGYVSEYYDKAFGEGSPAQTHLGKGTDAVASSSINTMFGISHPIIATLDALQERIFRGRRPIPISATISGSTSAITSVGESLFTGNSAGLETFQNRSTEGEYGWILARSSKSGDWWAHEGGGTERAIRTGEFYENAGAPDFVSRSAAFAAGVPILGHAGQGLGYGAFKVYQGGAKAYEGVAWAVNRIGGALADLFPSAPTPHGPYGGCGAGSRADVLLSCD